MLEVTEHNKHSNKSSGTEMNVGSPDAGCWKSEDMIYARYLPTVHSGVLEDSNAGH